MHVRPLPEENGYDSVCKIKKKFNGYPCSLALGHCGKHLKSLGFGKRVSNDSEIRVCLISFVT